MKGIACYPSFSIVIPTYQRRELVCEVVRALAQLEYRGQFEVIVVVDGSDDGTAPALAELRSPIPLLIIEQPNSGAAHARNRGAAQACSDILLFLDDDVIADRDLLKEHARMYRQGADAVIGDIPIDPRSPAGFVTDGAAMWLKSCRINDPLTPFDIFTAQLSVRRSVFKKLGGFDEEFTSGSSFAQEDADFGVRLLACCDVRYNPSAIGRLRYVVTPGDQMRRSAKAAAGDVRFATKHPQLSRQLLELKGASRPITRLIYKPLSRIPYVPAFLARSAPRIAEAGLKTRFRSSRLLGRFFGAARSIVYWAAVEASGGMPDSDNALVLCYHAIQDQSQDPLLAPYGVSRQQFEAHIKSLRDRGFAFIAPDAFAAFVRERIPLPRGSVLLTFDDCYSDLLGIARDVLHPNNIQAIAFAVTGMKSGTNEWDQQSGAGRYSLLSAPELRELAALGVEIGSHSRTHREMPLLSDSERKAEAHGSRDDLVAMGLPRPRYFAYPFGALDSSSVEAVRGAGYLAAFTVSQRRARRSDSPLGLPRLGIFARDRGWRFEVKTRFPWLFVRLEHRLIKLGDLGS